jgi:hypothetical protein
MNNATVRFRIEALRRAHGPHGLTFGLLRSAIRDARLAGRQDVAAALTLRLSERWQFIVRAVEGRRR